jgi:hypothetical protein
MPCLHCCSIKKTERLDRTAHGYRRFRCQGCGRGFNERTGWLCQLSGRVAQRTGVRLPEAVSGDRDQVSQRGHALHVDGPAAGNRDVLTLPRQTGPGATFVIRPL